MKPVTRTTVAFYESEEATEPIKQFTREIINDTGYSEGAAIQLMISKRFEQVRAGLTQESDDNTNVHDLIDFLTYSLFDLESEGLTLDRVVQISALAQALLSRFCRDRNVNLVVTSDE